MKSTFRIPDSLRRWSHREYRFAHRYELPDLRDWIIIGLIMLLMSSGGFIWETSDVVERAEDAISAADRVINCLRRDDDPKKTTLGGEYQANGATWVTICERVERRVPS